ncbi:uncharacterized protein RBU47_010305 [Passerculus sandwichensis]
MRLPAPRERWPDRCGKGPSGSPQPHSHRTPPAGGAAGVVGPPPRARPPPTTETPGTPPNAAELRRTRGPPRDPPRVRGSMGGEDTVISGPRSPSGRPKLGEFAGGAVPNGAAPPGGPPQPRADFGGAVAAPGRRLPAQLRDAAPPGAALAPLLRWVAPWIGAAPAAPLAARGGN